MVQDTTETSSALDRWRAATDWPLMVIAVGSLPILLVELQSNPLPRADRAFIVAVNVIVLVAFLVDYIVELCLTNDRRRYVRTEWASLLIVVAQALSFLPGLAAVGALRALRGARLLRIILVLARAVAIGGAVKSNGMNMLKQHTMALAFGLASLTWLVSASAFTIAEDVGEGHRVSSFFDALWWSLSTITTVGYGDVYPVTAAGRIIGGFTMIVGISTFALVTAKIAQVLVREEPKDADPGG